LPPRGAQPAGETDPPTSFTPQGRGAKQGDGGRGTDAVAAEHALVVAAIGNSAPALMTSLAVNLRRERIVRGWSLRQLATRADVSKALISRIERGEGNPSINSLFQISTALGVALSELLAIGVAEHEIVRAGAGRVVAFEDGNALSRLIFVIGGHRRLEIYEFSMAPGTRSEWEGRSEVGLMEFALVRKGRVLIGPVGKEQLLAEGDAIAFRQEDLNVYESLDEPVEAVCLIAYPT
jgi:transcriptional regulator with XRE-family HTH domain